MTSSPDTRIIIIENKHAESKKIAVKVDIERAETEEHYVESQNAGNAALATLKTIKNKTDELVAREKFEELDVQKQKADNNDTQHPHHHYQQEQARRV